MKKTELTHKDLTDKFETPISDNEGVKDPAVLSDSELESYSGGTDWDLVLKKMKLIKKGL